MADEIEELLGQLDDDQQECEVIACPPPDAVPANISQAQQIAAIAAPPSQVVDVGKHIERYESISEEILGSWRSDRTEAQGAIVVLRGLIDDTIAKGAQPSGTIMEVYVNAIKAKNDTNSNAIKVMENTIKLLAATKSSVTINNTQNNTIVGDLDSILADNIRDDDV